MESIGKIFSHVHQDSKRLLGLADCSSRNFSAHIAHVSLVMIRYNILASIKRTLDYDTIGGLFGDMYLGVHELTVVEKIASLGKSPEAEAPRQVSVIKNYRYKAMLMELSLFDISLSAKRRVFSSSSENCDGLPFTTLPLSLCASHERDFLK